MQLVFLINLMCLSQFRNFSERLVLAQHSSRVRFQSVSTKKVRCPGTIFIIYAHYLALSYFEVKMFENPLLKILIFFTPSQKKHNCNSSYSETFVLVISP